MANTIVTLLKRDVVLGDGGFLVELERRGYVDSGSGREKGETGRASGQYTPEISIEHAAALRELHQELLHAGAQVLQALTFFGTREKLSRAPRRRPSIGRPCGSRGRSPATAPWSPDQSHERNCLSARAGRQQATRATSSRSRSASHGSTAGRRYSR